MNNPSAARRAPHSPAPIENLDASKEEETAAPVASTAPPATSQDDTILAAQGPHQPETTITIPHTYTFAGETHTSTKTVPISSAAARAYLASTTDQPKPPTPATKSVGPTLRRPLARKGLLEPNPSRQINTRGPLPPRTDLPFSIGGNSTAPAAIEKAGLLGKGKENKLDRGEKLNTVEKSKLDWEAEVERAGMREELERAEKSGGSYLGRVEFLRRVEGENEERARVARLKTAGLA